MGFALFRSLKKEIKLLLGLKTIYDFHQKQLQDKKRYVTVIWIFLDIL